VTERDESEMTEDVLDLIEKERAYPDLSDDEIEAIRLRVQNAISEYPDPSRFGPIARAACWVAAGGLMGAALTAVFMPPKVVVETRETVRIERVEVPAPAQPREPTAPPDAPPTAEDATAPAQPSPARRGVSTASEAAGSLERTLIEQARSALARREFLAAIDAADRHASRFADGDLAEEREAIRIQAFALAGRRDEASRHVEAFRRNYPMSLHRAAISRAMGASPE
jgi:hypothetical protein